MAMRQVFLGLRRLASFARPLVKWGIGIMFAHASALLPVKRLAETKNMIAFWHPRPAYRVHVLLIPKKAITDLAELSYPECCILIDDMIRTAGQLTVELGLQDQDYRLILNAGGYQEIPQLHVHLIAD